MDQKSYCLHQKMLIEREKWLEGQKRGEDPGEEFVINWIRENAAKYREEYQKEYQTMIRKVADACRDKLYRLVPGVSTKLWDLIFKTVIDEFTAIWTMELVQEENERRKKHLEEI